MVMARLQALVVGASLVMVATSAFAQQPAAPPPPPPNYGPAITLEQAKKVMAGAEAEANKNKWNVCIAVLDSGGNLRLLRVPGASVLEGGIPIVHDGKVIGAVGVSGVTSQQDAQIGQAGIDAMK